MVDNGYVLHMLPHCMSVGIFASLYVKGVGRMIQAEPMYDVSESGLKILTINWPVEQIVSVTAVLILR